MRQRAASRLLGTDGVSRIAGLARALEVESRETSQVGRAGRVAIGPFLIEGDVQLPPLPLVTLNGNGCGRDSRRRSHTGDAHDHHHCRQRARHHFGAARYGNADVNVLCDATLSVQSGSVNGLQTNWVASSRSLKIADRPTSTT